MVQPSLGQPVRHPDGTIAVFDEGEPRGFSIGGVDGGPAYSGDDAAVWRVEENGDLIEMVFRGTEREAWAYMDGLKTPMFTGTPAEYDAWVESQQVGGGEGVRLAPAGPHRGFTRGHRDRGLAE